MKYELIATATFGVEAVVKREIQELGYRILASENGKITFEGDARAIVRANLWLRTADRVLLKMAEFRALTFEELFQGTKSVDWAALIPADGKFTVTCSTVKSKLHNEPACQSIVKKAIVEKMKETYRVERFAETGAAYTVKATLLKDRVTLTVDTSGTGLHKRGYRKASVEAPIKETLAAALIQLSFWRPGRVLVDPCCGSGTIPIEAALIGRNIAPGIARKFASQEWGIIPAEIWRDEKRQAYEAIDYDTELEIYGFDIDSEAVRAALANAQEAGLEAALYGKKVGFEVAGADAREAGFEATLFDKKAGFEVAGADAREAGFEAALYGKKAGFEVAGADAREAGFEATLFGKKVGFEVAGADAREAGFEATLFDKKAGAGGGDCGAGGGDCGDRKFGECPGDDIVFMRSDVRDIQDRVRKLEVQGGATNCVKSGESAGLNWNGAGVDGVRIASGGGVSCGEWKGGDAGDRVQNDMLDSTGNAHSPWANGVIITNCPYAVRIGDEKIVRKIFRALGGFLKSRPGWSLFAITPEWDIEKIIRKADRRRKLYNGNIETTYFQFHGEKPKRGK